MKKLRFHYSLLALLIILLGISSRKIEGIPLMTGDFLYAIMIYLFIRIVFIQHKTIPIAVLSLFICYGIEFLQLYQSNWMIELRKTLPGKYILGQGFLWSDIFAYTIGIAFIFILEKITLKYIVNETRFCIKQQK